MSEMTQEAPPAADQPELPSVGERLQQARQSQGLSLGEMARQLKLSVKQVEALERNDYRTFPGALWVRGFLRNYAKALGLDAEDLVAKAGLASEVKGESAAVAPTPAEPARERRRVLILTLGFIVVGLFVLGLLGQRAGDRPSSTVATSPGAVPVAPVASSSSTVTPAPVVLPDALPTTDPATPSSVPVVPGAVEGTPGVAGSAPLSAAPVAEVPAGGLPAAPAAVPSGVPATSPAGTGTGLPVTPASPPPPAVAAKPDAGPSAPAVQGSAPVAAATGQAAPVTPPVPSTTTMTATTAPAAVAPPPPPAEASPAEEKPRTIRFTFSQSVDVVVRDASGKILLGALQAAGTEKSVRGIPPFKVYMGNVNAVKYVYRGREVDPGASGRTGAAKLTLK